MMHSTRFRTLTLLVAVAAVGAVAASGLLRPPPRAGAAGPEANRAEPAPQQPAASAGEQAIRKAFAAYLEAMNKGDLDAVLAFWAADADYIAESGQMTRGRDAIAALFKKSLPELKGTKVSGKITALKFLRPEVALEDGTLEYVAADGTRTSNRYSVVWVKSGDKWLISSARDLAADFNDVPSAAYPMLQPLEWLVGEWLDDAKDVEVEVSCRWGPNKSFLVIDYAVKREDGEPTQVNLRIGWDPLNGVIRSWMFDSFGGFGEGVWRRDGKRWYAETSGVLPDGSTGEATNVYEFVDDKTFVWRSVDRVVDGQPVADSEIKFVRKAAK